MINSGFHGHESASARPTRWRKIPLERCPIIFFAHLVRAAFCLNPWVPRARGSFQRGTFQPRAKFQVLSEFACPRATDYFPACNRVDRVAVRLRSSRMIPRPHPRASCMVLRSAPPEESQEEEYAMRVLCPRVRTPPLEQDERFPHTRDRKRKCPTPPYGRAYRLVRFSTSILTPFFMNGNKKGKRIRCEFSQHNFRRLFYFRRAKTETFTFSKLLEKDATY